MSRLILHIDRLVLRGIDPNDADAVAAALQGELRHQLGASEASTVVEALRSASGRARIEAAPLRLVRGSPPEKLGRALAGPILRGVRS